MDTYLRFQLDSLEIQLNLAAALSDYDRQQNRVRSADGKWAKSSSAMSDGEKLNVFLDKEQKIWKADTPERQEAITTIAKRLAGTSDPVAKVWAKVSGGETTYRDAVLKKLAPAVALSGKDIKGIDIDERERAISDLDHKLQKVLPESEANKLITELILDVSDYEYKEMALDAKDRTTEALDRTLSDLSAPIKNKTLKEVVVDTFKNAADSVLDSINQSNMTDEQFYEGSRKKVQTEINRKAAQAEAREQLKRVGRNTQEMMNDIGTATVAGFEAATKAIGETEKKIEAVAQDVAGKVSSFFSRQHRSILRRSQRSRQREIQKSKSDFRQSKSKSQQRARIVYTNEVVIKPAAEHIHKELPILIQ